MERTILSTVPGNRNLDAFFAVIISRDDAIVNFNCASNFRQNIIFEREYYMCRAVKNFILMNKFLISILLLKSLTVILNLS